MEKNYKILSRQQSLGWNMNPGHPECEAGSTNHFTEMLVHITFNTYSKSMLIRYLQGKN